MFQVVSYPDYTYPRKLQNVRTYFQNVPHMVPARSRQHLKSSIESIETTEDIVAIEAVEIIGGQGEVRIFWLLLLGLPACAQSHQSLRTIKTIEAIAVEAVETIGTIDANEAIESIEAIEAIEAIATIEAIETIEGIETIKAIETIEASKPPTPSKPLKPSKNYHGNSSRRNECGALNNSLTQTIIIIIIIPYWPCVRMSWRCGPCTHDCS